MMASNCLSHLHISQDHLDHRQFPQKLVDALKGAREGGKGMVSLSSTGIFSVWFYPSKRTSAPFPIVLFTCVSPLSPEERWS